MLVWEHQCLLVEVWLPSQQYYEVLLLELARSALYNVLIDRSLIYIYNGQLKNHLSTTCLDHCLLCELHMTLMQRVK